MLNNTSSSSLLTYRRGQVEWALWQFSLGGRPAAKEISPIFKTRVKRLLEIDRARRFNTVDKVGKGAGSLVFSKEKPEGTGVDVAFTAYDAFIMALGLDLLRMGFVQSEVVLLMGSLRLNLVAAFSKVLKNPPDQQRRSARGKPAPIDREHDHRVFLVLQRVDLSEEFPAIHQTGRRGRSPVYQEPKVCEGLESLMKELDRMDQVFRRALVLDIAHTVTGVTLFLAEAPTIKRGRASGHASNVY